MEFDIQREIRIYGRQTDLARALGVTRAYISKVYTKKAQPSDAVLNELGWERITEIKRKDSGK